MITGGRSWGKKEFFVFKMGEITTRFHVNKNRLLSEIGVTEERRKNLQSIVLEAISKK